jgi:hypothetical protein
MMAPPVVVRRQIGSSIRNHFMLIIMMGRRRYTPSRAERAPQLGAHLRLGLEFWRLGELLVRQPQLPLRRRRRQARVCR